MAEVQPRPSATRGRGSGRGGRGGYSSRGGRRSSTQEAANGDAPAALPMVSLDEQGEMGQLKMKYTSELSFLRDMFPDWSDDDLVLALQDSDGDMPRTCEKITEGNVSQFSAVTKKTKEKSKVKKDASATVESGTGAPRVRGRGGHESTRGARGRGSDRGGRARGGRGGSTSVPRTTSTQVSIPTTDSNGWGDSVATTEATVTDNPGWGDAANSNSWDQPAATATEGTWASSMDDTVPVSEVPKSSIIPEGSKKSWASMLAEKKALPTIPKPVGAMTSLLTADGIETHEAAVQPGPVTNDTLVEAEATQVPQASNGLHPVQASGIEDMIQTPPTISATITDSAADLTPPRDQLTEDNLEHLPDVSQPPTTDTVASTRDPGSAVGTPYGAGQQTSTPSRPPMGGFATSALRHTGVPGRSASYQRRMVEQREAVVMPGNHAVDRAAVQFGSMGISEDSKPLGVDDNREEAQTRTPVAQSPPSQPRTSLPPASYQQSAAPEAFAQETIPTPKQAPGLPMPSQAPGASMGGPLAQQSSAPQQPPGVHQPYGQYGRYGAGQAGQEPSVPQSKPYDPFSQQLNYPQTQAETQSGYPTQSQAPAQHQGQGHVGGYNDYNSHYGTEQQRNTSGNYYAGGYGQQNVASQHEQGLGQQRTGSAFANAESGYGSSQQPAAHSRFGENQVSGHTTPNPTMASQHQIGSQAQQVHHAGGHHAHGQAGHVGYQGYQQTPYYNNNNSYYGSYMNQGYPNNNSYYQQQQGYGAGYGGKPSHMYGQPHQSNQGYGVSPQAAYEQSASPANAHAYGASVRGNDSSLSSGVGDYGRSGSTQPSQQNTSGTGGYLGHTAESYGRGATGNYGHGQYGQQQTDDSLKPTQSYGDSKSGVSPAMGQPGRTGSATNSSYGMTAHNQSNFPPSGGQQGFGGGYPSHLNQLHNNHGSGYGSGIGGLGSHQSSGQGHQASGYGGGYSGGFGNNYNSYGGQQRGGWGGNSYGH